VTSYTVTAADETTPANGGQTCTVTVTKTSKDQCAVPALTNGDLYEFTVVATNAAGPSDPSDPSSGIYPSAPPTLTLSPSRLVLPKDTSDSTTCTVSVLEATSCDVVVTGPKGVVIARGTATSAGSSAITVKVSVTAAGAKLAQPVGGVTGVLVATVVLTNREILRATGSLQIVEQVSKITLAGGILFASGSAKVSPAGVKTIKALGKTVKGAAEAECDGYTDNVGTAAANLKLGLARAKAVCAILAPYVKRTKSVSYGEADPVATNKTAAGRAKNRRVVIKVTI
jgi:outer membrane protein OmpA-like peptidoglycan-associated protein